MFNFLKKWFPVTISRKQGSLPHDNFSADFGTSLSDFFGRSARLNFLQAYKGWVYAAVSAIAQEVGDIQLRLMRSTTKGDVEVLDGELIKLIARVNPRMTQQELFEITQSHQELEGNAFWFLARDGMGKIREIWPLRPDRVTFTQDKENPLMIAKFFYRQKDGRRTEFEPKDIIHFQQFNAEGDYPFPTRGLSTVQAAMLAIDTNEFARQWNKRFFLNSARPDYILSTEGRLSPDEYERLKRKFESAHRGVENSHKFLLLQGGLKADKLTATQKEMDFVKQVLQSRDEILAIFRVPKTILGITDDVNRANAEATNFVFASRTIKPKMDKIVNTMNEFLVPQFGDDLFYTFESPVPEDRDRIVSEYEKGIDKWLSRNEIREAEGLPPTVEGDKFFGNFNLAPLDEVTEEKKNIEPVGQKEKEETPPANQKEEKNGDLRKTVSERVNELFNKEAKDDTERDNEKRGLTFNQIQKFGVIFLKGVEQDEKRIKDLLIPFFERQKKLVKETLEQNLKGLKAKEYDMKAADDVLPSEGDEIKAAIDLMTPEYRAFVERSGQEAIALVGSDLVFDVGNPEVQDFLKTRLEFFSESVHGTNFNKLRAEIQAGLDEQQSIAEISERIDAVYDQTNVDRIARTEASAISNFGNNRAYKQAGVQFKEWVNFNPFDDPCLIGGEIVPINDVFSNGLVTPPAHPNCVCSIVPIFAR